MCAQVINLPVGDKEKKKRPDVRVGHQPIGW